MAKKPEAGDKPREKKTQVILDAEIARKVGIITAVTDATIQDWVNSRLGEIVDAHLEAAMSLMGLDVSPKPKLHQPKR